MEYKELGRVITVHRIAPAYLQRAVFIVVLAFIFFLIMMFAFYIRQSAGYFLLASAFLILYLLTLFSWIIQRKNVVRIHENGIFYKTRTANWDEIESATDGTVQVRNEKPIMISKAIEQRDEVIRVIQEKIG